jgi:hypothetical protein
LSRFGFDFTAECPSPRTILALQRKNQGDNSSPVLMQRFFIKVAFSLFWKFNGVIAVSGSSRGEFLREDACTEVLPLSYNGDLEALPPACSLRLARDQGSSNHYMPEQQWSAQASGGVR